MFRKSDFTGKEFLTKDFTVNSFHSDFKGNLSLPSLFALFQEIAWEQATLKNFGYEHLREKGNFWVLSRVSVEITQLPPWTEKFSIITWPSGVEGLFALRDFLLFDNHGKRLVGATSSWLVVDIKSRRPQRVDAIKDRMPISNAIRAINGNARKISKPLGSLDSDCHIISRVSDIDVNGHINNTKYIEWAVNSISQNDYRDTNIYSVDVNFLSEGFCNESFTISRYKPDNNEFVINIKRDGDNKDIALVKFLSCIK